MDASRMREGGVSVLSCATLSRAMDYVNGLSVAAQTYASQKWHPKLVISFTDLSSESQNVNSSDPPMRLRKLVPATRPLKLARARPGRMDQRRQQIGHWS